jgi:hypothetical protein
MTRKLAALGFALFPVVACLAQTPATDAPAKETFQTWAKELVSANNSPVAAEPGDHTMGWVGPDGRKIKLTVKVPRPLAKAPTVTLGTVAEGEDARPAFDKALAEVRATHAGKLVIPKGTYVFKTIGSRNMGHWEISGLTDVTIDGGGSTLVFAQNRNAIEINNCHRMALKNLNIEFSLKMAALGTVVEQAGGNVLKIDPEYPVTAADTMGHMSEYDRALKTTIPGGLRAYTPPGSKEQPKFIGDQTYTSPSFQQKGMAGKSFLVFQQWYGGAAIEVKEVVGPTQSEDLIFDGLNLYSGPGMGFFVMGMKRGLGIWNCKVIRKEGALISIEYDAIHVLLAAGDISIHDNILMNQGDDGINLNNPVHPVAKIEPDGKNVVLSTTSRFIQKGDKLVAFDETNTLLGSAVVTEVPKPLGGPNNQWNGFVLDRPIPGLTLRSLIRDNSLVNSRVAIVHNTIGDCGCHGLLVQVPNVLVQDNTFNNTKANAIRLIANVASFKEGTGAINVLVKNNTINGSGLDSGIHGMRWAAIATYGFGKDGVTSEPANSYIDILGNMISNAQQGCITVSSAEHVNVIGNVCKDTNLTPAYHRTPSIVVNNSKFVVLKENKRSGTWTGEMSVDPATTKEIQTQASY